MMPAMMPAMVKAMMPATTESGANPMLTKFQLRLARLFLAMPEASGFALAGGAALSLCLTGPDE